METIQKYKLGSPLPQRYFKSKEHSSSNNYFRLNNPSHQVADTKVLFSFNNSINNRTILDINT